MGDACMEINRHGSGREEEEALDEEQVEEVDWDRVEDAVVVMVSVLNKDAAEVTGTVGVMTRITM